MQVWEFPERNRLLGDGLKIQVKTGKTGMLPEKIESFSKSFSLSLSKCHFSSGRSKILFNLFSVQHWSSCPKQSTLCLFGILKTVILKFRSPWIQNYSFLWISFHVTLISFQNLMSLVSLCVLTFCRSPR